MSSAERCRVLLLSRISRILRRGSVTFRPALRRSLPSTEALRYYPNPLSPIGNPMRSINKKLLLTLALGAVVSASSGCVYRMNIQQGNFLEARTVNQLQVGLTRSPVRYLLGTPVVPDACAQDR